jgi:ribosomal protein S18 acetylase RimI-like enzyme
MSTVDIAIRQIDFARDEQPLKAMLGERDRMRLEHCERAVADGDCFIFVADDGGVPCGWVVVHTNFRADQDWDPPDDDTLAFQQAENAYVENIEVAARLRSRGVGARLLEAAQDEARRRGKRRLWLHTAENNTMAHALFEREGWTHERSVYPPWRPASYTRIYKKEL